MHPGLGVVWKGVVLGPKQPTAENRARGVDTRSRQIVLLSRWALRLFAGKRRRGKLPPSASQRIRSYAPSKVIQLIEKSRGKYRLRSDMQLTRSFDAAEMRELRSCLKDDWPASS
jgi:hypothetical protein